MVGTIEEQAVPQRTQHLHLQNAGHGSVET